MLSRVGNPIAINPNKELLANIMKLKNNSHYKIIVERKDSIYNLTPDMLKDIKFKNYKELNLLLQEFDFNILSKMFLLI